MKPPVVAFAGNCCGDMPRGGEIAAATGVVALNGGVPLGGGGFTGARAGLAGERTALPLWTSGALGDDAGRCRWSATDERGDRPAVGANAGGAGRT